MVLMKTDNIWAVICPVVDVSRTTQLTKRGHGQTDQEKCEHNRGGKVKEQWATQVNNQGDAYTSKYNNQGDAADAELQGTGGLPSTWHGIGHHNQRSKTRSNIPGIVTQL